MKKFSTLLFAFLIPVFIFFLSYKQEAYSSGLPSDYGLVGHWTFDEGVGNIVGNNIDSSSFGVFNGSPTWVEGKIGKALYFDGIDDLVEINKRILERGSPFTVSVWAYFINDGADNVVLSLGSIDTGETLVINYQSLNNRILFDDYTKSGYTRLPFVPNNNWQHIVWTSDGQGSHKIYVNGGEKTEIDNPGGAGNPMSNKFFIGGKPNDLMKGSIDDIRIYDREMSSFEVGNLYEETSGEEIILPQNVVLNKVSGQYSEPIIINLSSEEGEEIYYTLDGSEPNTKSKKYTGQFLITKDTSLRARSFNGFFGDTVSADYSFDNYGFSDVPDIDSVLPQELTHHIILRNWLKTMDVSDFEVNLGPIVWKDEYANNVDDVFNIYNMFGESALEMASTNAIRLLPEYFTLEKIESNGKINLTKDSADPLGAVWWASWDYEGNPFGPQTLNSEAILKRALVVGAVDLMMHEDYWDGKKSRSDFIGGHLIWQVMPFYKGKHLLPNDVRIAYETGLRRLFDKLEESYPSGIGGKDMEAFQAVSMLYIADALNDDDLRQRWKERTMFVLDKIMTADGAMHVHGNGTDISYDGIWQYFIVWAASVSQDPDLLSYLEKANELKGELSFPEPTFMQSSGPNNWNTGTALDATSDQWRTQYRDLLTGKLVKNALYLPTIRGVSWMSNGVIKTESQLRVELNVFDERATNFYKTTEVNNNPPSVWVGESHWITRSNYLLDYEMGDYYSKLMKLVANGNQMLKAPVLRNLNYIKRHGQEFLTFKSDTFAGAIHTGQIEDKWAGNVSGLSGGGISAFWTKDTGSIVQGKNRGSQNGVNADSWTALANGPLYWSVHSILGESNDGKYFSSARILNPTREIKINDKGNQSIVKIEGQLGGLETDPDNIIQGSINYNRSFFVNRKGVFVKSRITSAGQDSIKNIYEMIPLFSSHSGQKDEIANLKVDYLVNGVWIIASNGDFVEGVDSVRLNRFGSYVYINFDKSQTVGLSDKVWQTWNARLINLMIKIDDGSGFVPTEAEVSYTISTAEDYKIKESLLNSF